MTRNSNIPAVRYLPLCVAIVLFLSGCARLREREQKSRRRLEQKIREMLYHRPPGNLHSVRISWTPSTSPGVKYNVYRSNAPGYPLGKLTSQPIAGTEFTDTAAVGGLDYNYYVTSVDSNGIESKPSAVISPVIPYP
jgi:fibronectin type 3 domain-containing protein